MLRLPDGTFFAPDFPREVLGIRAAEAWVFGYPQTRRELDLSEHAAPMLAHLEHDLVHRIGDDRPTITKA